MFTRIKDFYVKTASFSDKKGIIQFGNRIFPCVVGRAGVSYFKKEGDGRTPIGIFRFVSVFYRADRVLRPRTCLPVWQIFEHDGWCYEPNHPNYNQLVRLPFPANHERLMRKDRLYDILIVLDYNIYPCKPGAGSAIFLHIAAEDFKPTEGCIAVSYAVMYQILLFASIGSKLHIGQ